MQIVRNGVRFRKQQNRTVCAKLWGKHCRALLIKRASQPQPQGHSSWTLRREPWINLFIPYAATQGAPEMVLRHRPCYHQAQTPGFSSVQFSRSVMCESLRPHGLQHARLPCPSPTPGAHSNSCPLSRWCHPTISSSIVPFSHLQSFPASGTFPISQFFASGA